MHSLLPKQSAEHCCNVHAVSLYSMPVRAGCKEGMQEILTLAGYPAGGLQLLMIPSWHSCSRSRIAKLLS